MMSRFRIAAAASAIALMAALSPQTGVFAQAAGAQDTQGTMNAAPPRDTASQDKVEEAFGKIGEAIGDVAEAIATAITEKEPNVRPVPPVIDDRTTAAGMIGRPLLDTGGRKIGEVKDIILDSEGRARLVVTRENTLFGLGGNLMAYNYGSIAASTAGGDTLMPVADMTVAGKKEFSYTASLDPDVRVMPETWHSLKEVLDGKLIDPTGRELAKIRNVTMEAGRPSMLIAGYGEVLNMGGEKVALDFDAPELVPQRDRIDMRLSAYQTEKLQDFKAAQKQ